MSSVVLFCLFVLFYVDELKAGGGRLAKFCCGLMPGPRIRRGEVMLGRGRCTIAIDVPRRPRWVWTCLDSKEDEPDYVSVHIGASTFTIQAELESSHVVLHWLVIY